MNNKKVYVLNYDDYIFEINNKEVFDCKIEYYFDNYKVSNFVDGKKSVVFKDCIHISIYGTNESISFYLNMTKDELNNCLGKPILFNNKISDIMLKKFDESNESPLFIDFETYEIKDMFSKLSNFYIAKESENNFIFKLLVPGEIFLVFRLNIS